MILFSYNNSISISFGISTVYMNAIRIFQKTSDRTLVIDLPEFSNQEVEVIVLITGNWDIQENTPHLKAIKQFAGIAKHDLPINEDDYYSQ